uniref:Uncharacterized protein n=1 Tax=Meloidogyne hapla TaxID=6305 RepID=A0A1I8BYE7_MELHA
MDNPPNNNNNIHQQHPQNLKTLLTVPIQNQQQNTQQQQHSPTNSFCSVGALSINTIASSTVFPTSTTEDVCKVTCFPVILSKTLDEQQICLEENTNSDFANPSTSKNISEQQNNKLNICSSCNNKINVSEKEKPEKQQKHQSEYIKNKKSKQEEVAKNNIIVIPPTLEQQEKSCVKQITSMPLPERQNEQIEDENESSHIKLLQQKLFEHYHTVAYTLVIITCFFLLTISKKVLDVKSTTFSQVLSIEERLHHELVFAVKRTMFATLFPTFAIYLLCSSVIYCDIFYMVGLSQSLQTNDEEIVVVATHSAATTDNSEEVQSERHTNIIASNDNNSGINTKHGRLQQSVPATHSEDEAISCGNDGRTGSFAGRRQRFSGKQFNNKEFNKHPIRTKQQNRIRTKSPMSGSNINYGSLERRQQCSSSETENYATSLPTYSYNDISFKGQSKNSLDQLREKRTKIKNSDKIYDKIYGKIYNKFYEKSEDKKIDENSKEENLTKNTKNREISTQTEAVRRRLQQRKQSRYKRLTGSDESKEVRNGIVMEKNEGNGKEEEMKRRNVDEEDENEKNDEERKNFEEDGRKKMKESMKEVEEEEKLKKKLEEGRMKGEEEGGKMENKEERRRKGKEDKESSLKLENNEEKEGEGIEVEEQNGRKEEDKGRDNEVSENSSYTEEELSVDFRRDLENSEDEEEEENEENEEELSSDRDSDKIEYKNNLKNIQHRWKTGQLDDNDEKEKNDPKMVVRC